MEDQKENKAVLHKSPNYPAFPLSKALRMARILWDKDGKAGAPKKVALKHLGHNSEKSGSALRTLSVLKSFGLITTNEGRIVLTKEALNLAIYPQDDELYIKTLKRVSLKPSIYNELYKKYQEGFPSDATLKAELIGDHNFNRDKVDSFIGNFRSTIKLAGLDKREEKKEMVVTETPNTVETDIVQPVQPKRKSALGDAQEEHSYLIPLLGNNKAVLTFERLPVQKEDLSLLKQWIDLLEKPLTEK